MAFEFHLPDIGEGVIEGEIVEWKVSEGDRVDLDQPIVEVQTDKATVEIPSPRAGRIAKIRFREGEVCPVGDVLVVIEEDGAASEPAAAPEAGSPAAGGNGHGAGHAPELAQAATRAAGPAAPAMPEVIDATGATRRVLATPATRRLARQLGVDIAQVPPTGRNGRVTSDDVRAFAERGGAASVPAAGPSAALQRAPAQPPARIEPAGAEERIPFRGVRRAIAQNMTRSKFTATHFTYVEEVDMTELVELRTRAKQRAAERGIKLTYLPFIIKAVCAGLKKWPALNASLDEERQEIVRKHYYHIGIAAQGPQGLVVTVIRDADKRSIFELAKEIQRLADAVQSGTIKREELVGSTFTISSLGALGGLLATPIINYPEAGILGVHKLAQRAMVVDGQIVPRWMMNLSISLDHRIVDGWDGAMFVAEVKSLLEDPTMMFMELV
ncbi:MAG: 2-oxo acid dehydrogenase subunit E2 [Deltaproteobacteria bacterium]|nr:MAG: 2-oxo acid dehydrogenase subunit E2 [Deltaproteobacteria bacterium]